MADEKKDNEKESEGDVMNLTRREKRIHEIMEEFHVCNDVAEQLFLDEICDKYNTNDFDVAEMMYESEG